MFVICRECLNQFEIPNVLGIDHNHIVCLGCAIKFHGKYKDRKRIGDYHIFEYKEQKENNNKK